MIERLSTAWRDATDPLHAAPGGEQIGVIVQLGSNERVEDIARATAAAERGVDAAGRLGMGTLRRPSLGDGGNDVVRRGDEILDERGLHAGLDEDILVWLGRVGT